MTVKTIISPDDRRALATGVPESVQGGVILAGAAYHTPPFILVDGTPPDGRAGWHLIDGEWIAPALSPEQLKTDRDAKWQLIKAERDRRKAAGVEVDGHWLHSDTDSRVQWLGLKDTAKDLLAAGGSVLDSITIFDQPVVWKTLAGTFIPVTVQLALDVVQATKEHDAMLFKVAEQHRAAMEASADPAAYDFSTGWPLAFGE